MVHLPFRRCSVYLLLFTNTFHKVLIIFVIFATLSCKSRFKEDRRISGGVHGEEATLKGHCAPQFDSTNVYYIESSKDYMV